MCCKWAIIISYELFNHKKRDFLLLGHHRFIYLMEDTKDTINITMSSLRELKRILLIKWWMGELNWKIVSEGRHPLGPYKENSLEQKSLALSLHSIIMISSSDNLFAFIAGFCFNFEWETNDYNLSHHRRLCTASLNCLRLCFNCNDYNPYYYHDYTCRPIYNYKIQPTTDHL